MNVEWKETKNFILHRVPMLFNYYVLSESRGFLGEEEKEKK
jgi:hypothetical protein